MSIVWLEPFTFFKTDSNIFYFQGLNIIIYLNMISCICYIIYSMLYKMDVNMQRPPNTIIIYKMFGECLVSLNLLLVFLCFSLENNKRKLSLTSTFFYYLSLMSPCAMFLSYFFNLCLAHNLYQTFYAYKNSYDKRLALYKILALVIGLIVLVTTFFFNETHVNTKFTLAYYKIFYLGIMYLLGAFVHLYILSTIFYVLTRKEELFTYKEENTEARQKLLNNFVDRMLYYFAVFILCYGPNNVIQLIQIFSSQKICEECPGLSISCYLVSLSCCTSFCLKFTEPYMRKYFRIIISFLTRSTNEENNPDAPKDISEVYNEKDKDRLVDGQELVDIEKKEFQGNNLARYDSKKELGDLIFTIDRINQEKEFSDHISRLTGMCLSLNEDTGIDYETEFSKIVNEPVPWDGKQYKAKSSKINYTIKDFPDWLPKNDESKLITNKEFRKFRVSCRKYAGKVFQHIRVLDSVSIKEIIDSLHPIKNIAKVKESMASGGRSQNPIMFTCDKKFLIKTIDKSEKNIFLQMLPEYHKRMKDSKSLLCRIYALFRVNVNDKEWSHIIIMRNMCELPSDTKILTFDLKGSTEGRTGLSEDEVFLIGEGKKDVVIRNNSRKVLKDNDFVKLGLKFKLSKKDASRLDKWVNHDAELLKGNNITDYSLLVTIHSFYKPDYEKNKNNPRVMKSYDNQYLYNFSIIDFFCVCLS